MRIPTVLLTLILVGCTPDPIPDPDPESSAVVLASYDVFPSTVPFGNTPEATLRNTGNIALEYEHEVVLEMFIEGRWVSLLEPPPGPTGACEFASTALVLHPRESRTQKIVACEGHGRAVALAPGEYRVTKIVRTIPSDPGASPMEITNVADFEVAESVGEIPEPSDCEVLCISDTSVEGGQTVQVSFAPPRSYIWGVPSEIHAATAETATPIAFLTAWQHKDEELMTWWPGEGGAYEDIGFYGSDEWDWVVPERLEPGVYSIVKEGISRGNAPLAQRIHTWAVAFEVTS